MALNPGSKLGPYEVLSLLGAGGMGEVYRARDMRLGRTVAIKVLPADRMADENRRRRFVQEARAASALNHPNIVTIYEIESADGIDFIVMEYVEGQTLDAVIPRLGMKLADALRVAMPIADALARAHAAGIVHRDLKPANVAVSGAGVVKVLDFGLAKLVSAEAGSPEHVTVSEDPNAPLSRSGMIVGTAAYMSPEQATGQVVDARSDVFSFGTVLYEMLSGRRAFAGSSTPETLAAVVRDQPQALGDVLPDVPKELERLVQRCLRKEAERRFQNMLDVKLELEQIKEETESGRAGATPQARSNRRLWLSAALAGLLAMVATAWLLLRPTHPPPRLMPLTSMRGYEAGASLSPDGEQVAFTWNGEKEDNFDIYVKAVGSSDMRRLTTDKGMDIMPAWSPDGKQVAFVHEVPGGYRIHLISPIAGSDRRLSDFPVAFGTPSWSPDSRWLAVGRAAKGPGAGTFAADGLYLLPVTSGEPRAITMPGGAPGAFNPTFAPDGRRLAYMSSSGASNHISVIALGTDYMPTGAPRRISRRPIDPEGGVAWTRDGKSILCVEAGGHRLWRIEVTGTHPAEPIDIAGLGAIRPAVAASRDRLVFVKDQDDNDIYRFQVGRPAEALITSTSMDGNPQFSPDGLRIAFESERTGEHEIWLADADGSNTKELTHGPGLWQGWPRWSSDGRRIAFDSRSEESTHDIWAIDADGASPRQLTRGTGDKLMPSWSRDDRFIYFAKSSSGIWRVPAAGGSDERMIPGDAYLPVESIDGGTLFFRRNLADGAALMARSLAGGEERRLAQCVDSSYVVAPAGIYALDCWSGSAPLFLRDPATGRGRLLGTLESATPDGLTISPDGKTVLYTRAVNSGADLMLIDNFR